MIETWAFSENALPVSADEAVEELGRRIADGKLESWLTSSTGRSLAVVTNTERAMVMLLDGEGDPGEHASDPGAEDWSDGFILENGQNDEYPDEDTVLLGEAFRIVRHILAHGIPPADAAWTVDR
ncbi:hypothetical protein [Streptomyces sp. Ag109_G2-15]|uniref:hypothetical protein n=1 Tax=Streptomyces sp. Ag109_G2-15 TaxID=1938850 RepID=UPI000BC3D58E|nr:hypothetical protein [Streptomyces sp. Ag109_G2-15]SOD88007.1 hypothetical protein SAMN06272765_5494 [Streptomyces sp. Ag109_G2-15]